MATPNKRTALDAAQRPILVDDTAGKSAGTSALREDGADTLPFYHRANTLSAYAGRASISCATTNSHPVLQHTGRDIRGAATRSRRYYYALLACPLSPRNGGRRDCAAGRRGWGLWRRLLNAYGIKPTYLDSRAMTHLAILCQDVTKHTE